jgi:hypothetical protein
VAYLRHGNISRLVGGRLQLGGVGSCAQSSEGRVSALQHTVCLIVKLGAMWASLDLRSLCRMKIALFATVAAVSNPVINDKGTTCRGPKITSKQEGGTSPSLLSDVSVSGFSHCFETNTILIASKII